MVILRKYVCELRTIRCVWRLTTTMYALLTLDCGPGVPKPPLNSAAAADSCTAVGEVSPPRIASETPESQAATAAVAPAPVPAAASPTQRRLNFLFQASVHLSTKSPTLSRVLLQQLHEVARKHVLRLHASVKHSCCSSCYSTLLPHTTSVRQYIQGRCYCTKTACSCIGGACTTTRFRGAAQQQTFLKRPKRHNSEAPATPAANDLSPDCSCSNSGSACKEGNKGSSGANQRPCPWDRSSCHRCCEDLWTSRSCYCCCCCCRIGDEPERRRRRRRGQAQSDAAIEQQHRAQPKQLKEQQQPLMEVRCLVCGYVSRRP